MKHDMNYDVVNHPKHYTQGKYETLMALIHLHREERLKKPIRRI